MFMFMALVGIGLFVFLFAQSRDDSSEGLSGAEDKRSAGSKNYMLHTDITATVFWVGEDVSSDNGFIHNNSSAWMRDWETEYGGVDDPKKRDGYYPSEFIPKENPFYFALPYGDYEVGSLKSNVDVIPWFSGEYPKGGSLLKNRWIQVTHEGRTAYAQWQDVGPFEHDDHVYVFGTAPPKHSAAGIDLSPAAATYLGLEGRGQVSWRFVEAEAVPAGPWTEIITTSGPRW